MKYNYKFIFMINDDHSFSIHRELDTEEDKLMLSLALVSISYNPMSEDWFTNADSYAEIINYWKECYGVPDTPSIDEIKLELNKKNDLAPYSVTCVKIFRNSEVIYEYKKRVGVRICKMNSRN